MADGRIGVHREKGQLHGTGVGPTKGLSEKSLNRSLTSIHILYNHAPSRGVGTHPGRCTRLAMLTMIRVAGGSTLFLCGSRQGRGVMRNLELNFE